MYVIDCICSRIVRWLWLCLYGPMSNYTLDPHQNLTFGSLFFYFIPSFWSRNAPCIIRCLECRLLIGSWSARHRLLPNCYTRFLPPLRFSICLVFALWFYCFRLHLVNYISCLFFHFTFCCLNIFKYLAQRRLSASRPVILQWCILEAFSDLSGPPLADRHSQTLGWAASDRLHTRPTVSLVRSVALQQLPYLPKVPNAQSNEIAANTTSFVNDRKHVRISSKLRLGLGSLFWTFYPHFTHITHSRTYTAVRCRLHFGGQP